MGVGPLPFRSYLSGVGTYRSRLGPALRFVILSRAKNLSPVQPGHGSARCFAVLSMTMLDCHWFLMTFVFNSLDS
jgi:hypothetical protein